MNLDNHELCAGIGFCLIAILTWYLSSRPKLFFKYFTLPGPERIQLYAKLTEGGRYKKVLRGLAVAEIVIGIICLLMANL